MKTKIAMETAQIVYKKEINFNANEIENNLNNLISNKIYYSLIL